jgi:NitT/TauT family transport system permease protein
VWEATVKLLSIKEYLIPAPSKIAAMIASDWSSLLRDTGLTMLEAILGFLLANVLSIAIAVGFCHSRWFERSFYPYTIALKSIPVIAIAPLLVLWLGYGIWGKVVMAAIISFFPLVVNATLGLKSVDPEALDLMHSLSASRFQILLKLRFPTALPHIFSALKISSALAVVGAIVGELTGAKRGIGFLILMASYNVDTPLLFSAIVAASLGGILFFGGVAWAEKSISKKYGIKITDKEVKV